MEGGPSKYAVPPSKSPPVEPSQGLCGVLPEASCTALSQRNTGRGYSKLNLRSCFKGSRQTNISSINTWQKVWQAEITTVAHLPSIVNPVLTISACSPNEQQTSGQNQAKSMTMTMTWWHDDMQWLYSQWAIIGNSFCRATIDDNATASWLDDTEQCKPRMLEICNAGWHHT